MIVWSVQHVHATPNPSSILEAQVPEMGNKRMRFMENLNKQIALTELFKSQLDYALNLNSTKIDT